MRLDILVSLSLALFVVTGGAPLDDDRSPSKRIIDGNIAKKGQFPYQIALVMSNGKAHLCGGALIDDDTIITAAHCFTTMGPWPQLYSIVFGKMVVSWRKDDDYYDIKAIRLNDGYHENPGIVAPDDIAVVKLARKVKFTKDIKPVSLPESREDKPAIGTECYIAGFGMVPGGSMAGQMMYTKMNVARIGECINFYSMLGQPMPTPHTRLCVNGKNWRNICSGDSGGPLVCKRPDGRTVVDGVVSYGMGCAAQPPYPSPSVFTRISSFLRWIKANRLS